MIEDKDIAFATTTLYTECLPLQQRLIEKLFPGSQRILIDGRDVLRWPSSMFEWIEAAKNQDSKWTIHLDEDCFVTDRQAIEEAISMMESLSIDILGCPDGYHPPRPCNPIAINPFFMICRTDALRKMLHDFSKLSYKLDFKPIQTSAISMFGTAIFTSWRNSAGISFRHSYKDDFFYPHEKNERFSFEDGKEPYYALFWHAKDIGLKLGYLYPHFDENLLTTNPSIKKGGRELCVHMWESRHMKTDNKFYGKTARERFSSVEEYLKEKGIE